MQTGISLELHFYGKVCLFHFFFLVLRADVKPKSFWRFESKKVELVKIGGGVPPFDFEGVPPPPPPPFLRSRQSIPWAYVIILGH